MTAQVELRPAHASETALVIDSWVKSFDPKTRRGPLGDSYTSIGVPRADVKLAPNLWWAAHRLIVGGILDGCAVIIAYHRDAPSVVLGWIAFEAGMGDSDEPTMTLHYAWVRSGARCKGLGKLLLSAAMKTIPKDVSPRFRITHSTPSGERLLASNGVG